MSEAKTHTHAHTPQKFGTVFAVATVLNVGIVAFELTYGVIAGSTALIADALHNSGDVVGLILAWGAYVLAKRVPSARFTYGLRSGTVLAAIGNGMLIIAATGAIVWEAIQRFSNPVPVEGGLVMGVAAIAIVFNGFSAWLLSRGGKNDVNIRSAFWHLAGDTLVSVGVVVSAFLMLQTGAEWLDPVTSLVIAVFILWSTWGLMKEAIKLSLHAVPSSVDYDEVKKYLSGIKGVERIHDLHVWPISTTETALTAHFIVTGEFDSAVLSTTSEELEHTYNIGHATIQLETPDGKPCRLAPDEVV